MSIYTTLPEDDPILTPQARAAIKRKQQRAYLFSVMEKVKGFVVPVRHQSPLPGIERAIVTPPNPGCDCLAPSTRPCYAADCPLRGVTPR